MFCLVQIYNVTHERLKAIKPLVKLISFKAIVFATWWQGVGIALLCAFQVLPSEGKFQTGLQDFLICIELLLMFVHVFPMEPFLFDHVPRIEKVTAETTTELRLEEGENGKPSIVEKTETKVEAPGTGVTDCSGLLLRVDNVL